MEAKLFPADLARAHQEGWSQAETARHFCLPHSTVRRAQARYQVTLRRGIAADRTPRLDHRAAVKDMKPLDAVNYLLDLLDFLLPQPVAECDWQFASGKLPPQGKRLVRLLASARGAVVSREAMFGALYGDRPDADWPESRRVDVVLCKVRKVVTAEGLVLKTHWGVGAALHAPRDFIWPWERSP